MKRIGITGQQGFVGGHLYNTLGLFPEEFERIPFDKSFFTSSERLDSFIRQCDVVVHLAALNRHESQEIIYETNLKLAKDLVSSLERTQSKAQVIISSSTQEERDTPYGQSKKIAREIIMRWAKENDRRALGLIIPNVFGAFGRPFYNSFIATFCHQLTHGERPSIAIDSDVKLIYVQDLTNTIIRKIREEATGELVSIEEQTTVKRVSEVLDILVGYKELYLERGEIPILNTLFEINLFNTFRSFIDYKSHYPIKFTLHSDPRGTFAEIIRLNSGGQVSFSTTMPGITRGNHFHTRKIERFAVIKGRALIQLRRIDSEDVLNFELNGDEPAYVDMPIWYTHNIKNIGDAELYTVFWINEPYNPSEADTYFVNV